MQLTLHQDDGVNLIRRVESGAVTIGDQVFASSLLVLPDAVHPDWPVQAVTTLSDRDAEPLLSYDVDVVLLGSGQTLQFPPVTFQHAFAAAGIGLETMDTVAACRTYNVLVSEGRRALAALLL